MRYKILGRSGMRVSEICLGAMTFGTEWGQGADKDESRKIFKAYIESGGNFIDTANRYTEGTSEKFLGEFVKEANNRNELVIATKYSLFNQKGKMNDGGNHKKNMIQTVEGSLKRLGMDYIDLLYIHAWDFSTPVDEIMKALEFLVNTGKVLHIAISDTPAWIVARANTLAELRGWSQFAALQVEYSLITRDAERDLIPMAEAFDITVTPWAPLAGGALTGKYLKENDDPKRLKEGSKRLNEKSVEIAKECLKIADEIGCSAGNVALKWTMKMGSSIIPIVGARKLSHMEDNLKCVNFDLTVEQMKRLDEVSKIELGFPHDFLESDLVKELVFSGKRGDIDLKKKL
jgi:aryl-alcohol dehydrogenase-like predicted oxidoreductase